MLTCVGVIDPCVIRATNDHWHLFKTATTKSASKVVDDAQYGENQCQDDYDLGGVCCHCCWVKTPG